MRDRVSRRGMSPDGPQNAGAMPEGRRLAMAHLKDKLTAPEFARVSALTRNGRRLPFGPDSEAALERLLLEADDEDLELLIKCQSALESLPLDPGRSLDSGSASAANLEPFGKDPDDLDPHWEPVRPSPRDRLRFHFDYDSQVLSPFLVSLRRNGFRTVTVESETEVDVFVALGGSTDLEVFREMELVKSLFEIVHGTVTHSVRGWRLTP